jgi:hypothetical protein
MRDVYLWTPPLAIDSQVRIAQWGQNPYEIAIELSILCSTHGLRTPDEAFFQ